MGGSIRDDIKRKKGTRSYFHPSALGSMLTTTSPLALMNGFGVPAMQQQQAKIGESLAVVVAPSAGLE
jgi:hypothetical protein